MRNLALMLLLAALLPTTGACASLDDSDELPEAPGGSKGEGFGGSGGTAVTGGNGGSPAGGAGGPPNSGASGSGDGGGGGGKLEELASEACLACVRALCLNCPAENPSCDPCTVHPWLCSPQEADEASEVFQCVCAGSCASECGDSAACAAPVLGGAGAGGEGGMGSENAGAAGSGEAAAGGNDVGAGAGGSAGVLAEDCFNGVDDTFDDLVDCADPACAVACADPCSQPIALVLNEQSLTAAHQAVWEGHANVFTQDCASSVKTGPDIVYEIKNSSAKAAFVRVSASSKEGDVVLARKDKCSGGSQDIPCQNKVGVAGTETFEVLVEAGASIFAVVGAADAGAAGGFSIEAKLIVPSCGDGVVTPDEACDDAQDEGCNSSCQIIACDDATPVDDGKTISVSQKDAKLSSSLQPSCSKLGTSAGEYIHSIRAKHSGWLQAVLRSSDPTDLTLSLWSSCLSGAELACADRASGASGALERLVVPVGSGELHQVVVDSYDALPVAAYELFARSYPAECGDDVVSPVEQCDGTEACEPDCTSALAEVDEIEPNEVISQATTIQPSAFSAKQATLGGRIGQAGDVDLFLLSVPEGGLLEVATDEPGDGSCKRQGFSDSPVGLLDSELRLLTPEGTLLAVNDNGPGDGFCSRLQAKVTGGSYLIQVRASSAAPAQVFSYLLRVSLPLIRNFHAPTPRSSPRCPRQLSAACLR